MISHERCIQALAAISAQPTAPFYEARVARYILGELKRLGLPVQQDSYGNLIATYTGAGAPETGGMALVAHMDHPACEIIAVDGTHATARLLGGVYKECFDRPVAVRVFPALPPAAGEPDLGIAGQISSYQLSDEARLLFELELEATPPDNAFGIWDLPQIEIHAGLAYLRAVDDLAGCASILLTLETLVERDADCRCYGVFTRAEEVGLLGATLLAQAQILPMDTIIVSLETSKTLPGAEIGAGPVIRVGDRIRTFDGNAETLLTLARNRLETEIPGFQTQRQLMSGGGCEATTFVLEGYPTTAMALPLGNYHNVGPGMLISPEYIHLADFAGQVELLARAATLVHTDSNAGLRGRLRGNAAKASARLRSSFATWEL